MERWKKECKSWKDERVIGERWKWERVKDMI